MKEEDKPIKMVGGLGSFLEFTGQIGAVMNPSVTQNVHPLIPEKATIGGDNIEATVGDNASEVTIGKNITKVTHQTTESTNVITQSDIIKVQGLFADLRQQIESQAPTEKKQAAQERIQELQEAILTNSPDLTTIEYVKIWFAKNLPQLAGNVTSVLVNPIVGKIVEVTGELIAGEFKRRFGQSQ